MEHLFVHTDAYSIWHGRETMSFQHLKQNDVELNTGKHMLNTLFMYMFCFAHQDPLLLRTLAYARQQVPLWAGLPSIVVVTPNKSSSHPTIFLAVYQFDGSLLFRFIERHRKTPCRTPLLMPLTLRPSCPWGVSTRSTMSSRPKRPQDRKQVGF